MDAVGVIASWQRQTDTWLGPDGSNSIRKMSSPGEMVAILIDDLNFIEFIEIFQESMGSDATARAKQLISLIQALPEDTFQRNPKDVICDPSWASVRDAARRLIEAWQKV